MKTETYKNGSKSTIHSEGDLLSPLNSIYSFSETSATLIDCSEKTQPLWWFEFQIPHVIEERNKSHIFYLPMVPYLRKKSCK